MTEVTTSSSRYYSTRRHRESRGRLVAQLLAGAWKGPALPICPEELAEIANLITACGAGGLAWCGIRGSNLNSSQTTELFQAQYRFQSLQAKLHERSLKKVIPILRGFGVEPLLVKGWSIARRYPEAGMRPYIDLDLCVLPDDHSRANAVLTSRECDDCNVDLHVGFGKFYDRRTDEVFARSQLMKLDDVDVRVLSAEDELRFLCMHLLRHGAILPLWLCDIAVLLEARSSDFDWERCLSGSHREADWVACAIGLAHQLLGVDVEAVPVARRAHDLPSWLVPAVLQSWGTRAQTLTQIRPLLQQPVSFLRNLPNEIRLHWPNPIEATMTLRGPFNRLPRLPFQVGHVMSRSAVLVSQLLGDIRRAIPLGS